ncbi:AEC family transporter [Thermoanaerobacterium sp. DL9XJH110]|uniref:AEC family transporter n=1 Tax=Thermoanaerobacterium sp. DL9XJH110 TaxID=3386643 RepID=UPI003BB76612
MNYNGLLESIATIIILTGIGFLAAKLGIIKQNDTKALSNLIFYITSPALILSNVTGYFTRDTVLSSLAVPQFAVLMTLLSLIAAYAVGKIIKIEDQTQIDVFYLTVSFCNTVFIGLPIVTSIYGESAAGFVFFYDLGSGMVLWTLGMKLACKGCCTGEYEKSQEAGNSLKGCLFTLGRFLKNLINPPLVALTVAVFMVMLEIPLPGIISRTAKTVGDITIPLSMLFIGMAVGHSRISGEIFDTLVMWAAFIRLIISPLLVGGVVYFVPVPLILKKVITIEAAMPVMMFTAILADKYNKHSEFAAKTVLITTFLSMVTIPAVVYLLELIY